ncbi:MAG: cytochrome b N-terminal domain-containing protein [Acidimicrobiales bacterium]
MLAAIFNLAHHDVYVHWGFILISLSNFLVVVAMLVLFALALLVPFVHSRKKHRSAAGGDGLPSLPGSHPVPAQGETAQVEAAPARTTLAETAQVEAAPAGTTLAGTMPDTISEEVLAAPPESHAASQQEPDPSEGLWTASVRRLWLKYLPPKKMLPDSQPSYVSSWVYVFGVLTLSALVVAILSGLVLAIKGPTWWHTSSIGHFDNSLHLWSVEMFMAFMAIHLWGKFWMAAWRGGRTATWISGVLAFVVSIVEAFTGYLSQTNFDSQWIAFESKDAFNASGIGSLVNPMNFGQALMLHIALIPLVLVAIVGVHILMVRVRGVVHPIDALPEDRDPEALRHNGNIAIAEGASAALPLAASGSEILLEDTGER